MTKRDNFIAFFTGKEYDHIPILMEDTLTFNPRELHDHVARGFVSDGFPFDRAKDAGGKGWFGVDWEYEAQVGGSISLGKYLDDINEWPEKIQFPDLDAIDWEGIAARNAEYLKTDKIKYSVIFTGFFERVISFMGFMDAAMAMIDPDCEDAVKSLFDKLSDLYCDYIERLNKYFGIEFIELHDDWGTQASAMMSLDAHHELIFPYVKKVVDKCHSLGIIYLQHSCGNITDIFPDIIEAGTNTWFGQDSVGIKEALVRQYGKDFIFGVEVAPPDMSSTEAIKAYMEELVAKYKNDKVWFRLPRRLTPEQKQMVIDMIQSK